jgi:arylsulfatase A-like enzyme
MNRYWANFDSSGSALGENGQWLVKTGYRLDIQTDAALTFIEHHHKKPFFLYLAYFAPHVPLEATKKYLERFPHRMPERRRYALAMISAIDDGVGRIREALRRYKIADDTVIFFISDNGAPLKIEMKDLPVSFRGGAWDGSRNDPLVGEKGMLSEGGIRVPFLVTWTGGLPRNIVYQHPVISLDVAATALALAGLEPVTRLDGVNLIPYLRREKQGPPHEVLYWRFWSQTAVRRGRWKYLQAGGRGKWLFDLESPEHERRNRIKEHPDIAAELRKKLQTWTAQMKDPIVPDGYLNKQEERWYSHYFGLEPAATKQVPKIPGG